MTNTESTATLIGLLRSQMAGDPMPEHGTHDAERIAAAFSVICNRARDSDLTDLGGAALGLLVDGWQAHLQSQRAQVVAQLSAMKRSDGSN